MMKENVQKDLLNDSRKSNIFSTSIENIMLFLSLFLLLILIVFSFICFFTKQSVSFWENYWTGIPVFVTLIIALSSFYFQLRIENKRTKKNKMLKIQENIETEIIPKFTTFSEISNKSDEQLINDLTELIVTVYQMDNMENENKKKYHESSHHSFDQGDYLPELKVRVSRILKNDQYGRITNAISNSHSIFSSTINNLIKDSDSHIDQAVLAEESNYKNDLKKDINLPINGEDMKILGYWILKYESAFEAKYLIGISTATKRVIGVYDIYHKATKPDENNRIRFNVNEKDRIYIESNRPHQFVQFPGLENWTAQNPVLYYLDYLNWKNIKLNDNQKKYIANLLNLSIADFDKLKGREIIIVRTYKFD